MSPKKRPDEPMIPCPSCGTENRIATPFCKSCGDRIYKGGAAPTPEATSKKKEPGRGAKAFRSAVNSLLFLALVGILGLAFWPYASLSVPTATDPTQQVTQYLSIVEGAIENSTQIPTARISQRNLNAYLGQNNDADLNKLLGVVLSPPGLELIANEPVGPFHLSTRMVMGEVEGEEHPQVKLFWVGHLPLPALWAAPWSRSLSNRFDLNMQPELWDHLVIDKVAGNSVYVRFNPEK